MPIDPLPAERTLNKRDLWIWLNWRSY